MEQRYKVIALPTSNCPKEVVIVEKIIDNYILEA